MRAPSKLWDDAEAEKYKIREARVPAKHYSGLVLIEAALQTYGNGIMEI